MKISPKVRFSLIWLSFLAIWVILLLLTEWRVFPCRIFEFDSEQGYYNETCPLLEDRDFWVFETDTSGFNSMPNVFTWLVGIPLILGVPALLTFLVSLMIRKFRTP